VHTSGSYLFKLVALFSSIVSRLAEKNGQLSAAGNVVSAAQKTLAKHHEPEETKPEEIMLALVKKAKNLFFPKAGNQRTTLSTEDMQQLTAWAIMNTTTTFLKLYGLQQRSNGAVPVNLNTYRQAKTEAGNGKSQGSEGTRAEGEKVSSEEVSSEEVSSEESVGEEGASNTGVTAAGDDSVVKHPD